mgnify:CR=1 FL=1
MTFAPRNDNDLVINLLHFTTNLLHLDTRLLFMKHLPYFFIAFVLMVGCNDDDDNIRSVENDLEVEDFVWEGLNTFYYWQSDIADLDDNRFSSNKDYATFLSGFGGNPEALFNHLLSPQDRFSFVIDDYVVLENLLNRVSKTSGMKYGLAEVALGSEEIIGFVRYVLPGTDADTKGLERGDLFWGVDGVQLTKTNYQELLSSESDGYTLNLASDTSGSPSGTSLTLTTAVVQENPVHVEKIIELNGQKVGYLMYNAFLSSRETELENAFQTFQTANVDQLVLDLRYNPGGSVGIAIKLATMTTGQFDGEIFAKTQHNDKLSSWNEDYLFENLATELNMSKIYVIVSRQTASASELIINGLKAHIDVVVVGEATVGKNVGSYTIYDWIDNDGNRNPNHTWAMQPIAFKITDKNGNADFANGLSTDVSQTESIGNLGILGDTNEPLLNRALQQMGLLPQKFPNQQKFSQSVPSGKFINTEAPLLIQHLSADKQSKMEVQLLTESYDPKW